MPDKFPELSLSELRLIHEAIIGEVKTKSRLSKQERLLMEVKMLCAQEGVAFKELIRLEDEIGARLLNTVNRAKKTGRAKQSKKPLKQVYFHQTDPGKSWSGRGRRPQWVVDWIEQGKDIEKLKTRPGKK